VTRTRAAATAATVTLTVLAATAAFAANMGLLDEGAEAKVGELDATTATQLAGEPAPVAVAPDGTLPPEVTVVYEDVPAPAGTAAGADVSDDFGTHPSSEDDEATVGGSGSESTTPVPGNEYGDDHDEDGAEVDEDGPEVDEDGPEVDEDGPEGVDDDD
jgi:hypothetical protein